MNTQYTYPQKPTLVNVIAWMTLANGIFNILWGLGLSLTGLLSIIGIFCVPLMILPAILGIFEIIYAAKLLSNPPQPVRPATTLAILEIVCFLAGNMFSVVVGILSLVFYNDQVVKDYFARLNETQPPMPMPPAPQITPVTPVPPAPVEPPIPSPLTGEMPVTPAPPVTSMDETIMAPRKEEPNPPSEPEQPEDSQKPE